MVVLTRPPSRSPPLCKAEVCEIYTDVDGVFTADPRIVPAARRIERLSYEEMLEMAASGAKILHLRCVEYARRFAVPIHVRSSFSTKTGTWIVDIPAEEQMEAPIISGVAHERGEAKITVVGVPDKPGEAAQIFTAVADAGVNIDMIVQNVSSVATGLTDITFTLPSTDLPAAVAALDRSSRRRLGSSRCSPTTRSARCRWSAPGCARIPASPPSSLLRWPMRASTSR